MKFFDVEIEVKKEDTDEHVQTFTTPIEAPDLSSAIVQAETICDTLDEGFYGVILTHV